MRSKVPAVTLGVVWMIRIQATTPGGLKLDRYDGASAGPAGS